jgi:hypothetical protein
VVEAAGWRLAFPLLAWARRRIAAIGGSTTALGMTGGPPGRCATFLQATTCVLPAPSLYSRPMNVRDQLLAAAARVYSESGYRGATTRRIALEAGVNEITLFRHFGSKDALLREALARCHGDAGAELPEVPRDPPAELAAWAGSHLTDMRERRALIRTCMGSSPSIRR